MLFNQRTLPFVLLLLLFSAAPTFAQIVGTPQQDDHFGNAVATGDFDGDGYDDVVVGVPGDNFAATEAGSINVIYGSGGGLDVPDNTRWAQGVAGVLGAAEDFDWFGYSVAVGDFNGDNYDDVAISVPYEDVGATGNAGAVNILYGSTSGLQTAFNQLWVQGDLTLTDEANDRWGWDLASGDFDNDGYDDLAVGAPWESIGGDSEGGVTVIYGTSTGLSATDAAFWTITSSGISASATNFDNFGYSLAVGNFDNDNYDDLAIGIIGDDEGDTNSGSVGVMYGSNTGLAAAGSQLWSQDTAGINGAPELGDQFGWDVASGDFDNDNFDDLAIGVPFEDDGATSNSGAVNIIYGSGAGLTATGNQLFSQASADIPLAVEEDDNFGYSLATGTLGADSDDELIIGVAGEGIGAIGEAGSILVIAGSPTGLDPTKSAFSLNLNEPNVEGNPAVGDRYGHALATGDFDDDGVEDIVAGIPNKEISGATEAGAISVLYHVFLVGGASSQLWFQGAVYVANEPEIPGVPSEFSLLPAYPNPFNPSTTVRYEVPEAGNVQLSVFDALGRQVATLVNENHSPGSYEIAFDAQGLPSGMYLVRLEAGAISQTQRITLLR